jgi:hypothetical protein
VDIHVLFFIKEIDNAHRHNRLSSEFWNSAMKMRQNNPAKELQELNEFGKPEKSLKNSKV